MSEEQAEVEYEYVRIADFIAADIASGRLPLGARLPGERELASIYGVSTSTAQRVRRELLRRGLVKVLRAKGTYVVRRPDGSGTDENAPAHPS